MPASATGLRYASDADPGCRRVRRGRGFQYLDQEGKTVTDPVERARIAALAVPPAWRDVWINPHASGHIQAVGRDARGRKQYRYHPDWRRARDADKFERMRAFGRRLPRIREAVEHDLSRRGLPREKVLALVVRLLELTHLRVGGEEYARVEGTFGLSTLRDTHAQVDGSHIRFRFRGKGGRPQEAGLRDRRLARLIASLQELPGQRLFEYVDDEGGTQAVDSEDVNTYLRSIAGVEVTAKDFRTWAGTLLAFRELLADPAAEGVVRRRRQVRRAIEEVAGQLGNTAAVARRSYVDPTLISAWQDGALARLRLSTSPTSPGSVPSAEEEAALLRLLDRQRSPRG